MKVFGSARSAGILSVADQGCSSLSNLAVLLVAARIASAEAFGRFSTVYITYVIIAGVFQALFGQVAVLRQPSQAIRKTWADAARVSTFSLLLALLLLVVVVLTFHGQSLGLWLVLTTFIPALVLQDYLRFASSALRRPEISLASDATWVGTFAFVHFILTSSNSIVAVFLEWSLAGVASLLLMLGLLILTGSLNRGDKNQEGSRSDLVLGCRFTAEYLCVQGAPQLCIIVLGLLYSVSDTGALRSVSTLMGPLIVAFTAATSFGAPILNRSSKARDQVRGLLGLAVLLFVVSCAWMTIFLVLPEKYGAMLLGATWVGARSIVLPTGLQYSLLGLIVCARLFLRVRAPRRTLPVQLVTTPLVVASLVGGYEFAGLSGAAWGLFGATILQLVFMTASCVRTVQVRSFNVEASA